MPGLYFWVQYIDILFQNICILLSNADCKNKLCVKLHRVSLNLMGFSESCEWVISAWVKTVEVHLSSWVDACWCDLHSSFSGEVGFSNHKAMFAHYRSLDYDLIFLFQHQKHASESDLNRCYIRAHRPRLGWFSHYIFRRFYFQFSGRVRVHVQSINTTAPPLPRPSPVP